MSGPVDDASLGAVTTADLFALPSLCEGYGIVQLNEDDQGYRDDLVFTYRRASGGDG